MTERIDLDDFEADESTAEDAKPRGSWFWEGDGDPDDEVDPWTGTTARETDAASDVDTTDTADPDVSAGSDTGDSAADDEAGDDASDDRTPVPRVPRTNEDRPVGIPMESGGSGGAVAGAKSGEGAVDVGDMADVAAGGATDASDETAPADAGESDATPGTQAAAGAQGTDTDSSASEAPSEGRTAAASASSTAPTEPSGPHGGGVDEMTLAFTYNAITRLSHLHGALADANEWTDWIGIVGDVEAYVINKFQRDNHLDLDFFNGSGTGPGERLAAIDEHSMFYAERMVVVGVAGEDEAVAEEAGWEFVSLDDAAAKAGWELDD